MNQADIKPLPWLGGPRTQCLGDISPDITKPSTPLGRKLPFDLLLEFKHALKCQSLNRVAQWHGKALQTRLAAPRHVFITQSQSGQELSHITMLNNIPHLQRIHSGRGLSHLEEDAFANSIWFSDLDYLALPAGRGGSDKTTLKIQ